ncbi:hypothetical protein HYX03_02480 [Candidatus Woesearchaeota archaeon]|nr:hypothetical protein [Candidatus Woesearchaeota archaeon]
MRGLVIVLLALVAIASFSFIAVSTKNINDIKTEIEEKPKVIEFSTFTSAICEDKDDFVQCKDEFFVNCNGQVSKAADAAECNGIKYDVPKTLGFAVFEKGWKDPRN